jgi:hypothetical protein
MEWQPIETAPNDTYVLVYGPDYYGDEYFIAIRLEEVWGTGHPFCPLGCAPTHWMHLPEPPEEDE